MGWISSIISGIFGIGQQAWSNAFAKNEAQKNRDFQSDEAEINRIFQSNEAALQRDWSAAEAERARDWQEEMNAKYHSISGKIAQAEQAGVNPMFAVTGNAVSPASASGSVPSGASAGGVGTPSGATASAGLVNILGELMNARKIDSEIAVNESIANKNNADAEGQKITNETLRDMNVSEILSKLSNIELNNANIGLISSKVLNTNADTDVKSAQLNQIASQIANTDADTAVKEQQIAVMLSDIAKNDASINLMNAQSKELGQQYENLVQQFGHNEVINAITEVSLGRDTGVGEHSNGYYRAVSEVKRFINSVLGWFSGGASVTKKFGD